MLKVVLAAVDVGYGEGIGVAIGCKELSVRKVDGYGNGYRAASGSYVSDSQVFCVSVFREMFKHALNQKLSLLARYQDMGIDYEVQAVKLSVACDVGQWLAIETPLG